ncbi:MAG: FliM/FliN family flagellar motor switch protein [Myxococcales bacterium]
MATPSSTARDVAALRTGDVMIVDELTARADKGEKGTARLHLGAGRTGRIEAAVEVVDGAYQATIEQVVLGEEAVRSAEEESAAAVLAVYLKAKAAAQDSAKPRPKPPPPVAQLGDDDEAAPGQDTAITDLSERMRHERKKNGWEENTNVGNKPEDVQADAAELLNDVPLQISVELARVPITAEELVSLHVGKILELGKAPGEPVDLSVNGKIVARGELVEVEGQLGVRIVGMAQ